MVYEHHYSRGVNIQFQEYEIGTPWEKDPRTHLPTSVPGVEVLRI